jgi:hypothetical protein
MILKTTPELKKYINISTGFSFAEFKACLDSSLETHIYPWLSKAQYTTLNTQYNSTTINASSAALLPYVQRALAWIALWKYSFMGDKTIGTLGINVNTNEESKMLAQWRMEDLRDHSMSEYDSAIEQMLIFLEENKATYTDWASSSSFTIYKECFINNVATFNDYFLIANSRRTFLAAKGIMKRIEDFMVKSITGDNLFAQIKTQIASGTTSAANLKLLTYIQPAVALLTGAKACIQFPFTVTDSGLVIKSTSSSLSSTVKSTPADNLIEARIKAAEQDGMNYLKQLKDYLYNNHATYPLYEADTTVYVTSPTTDVNTAASSLFMM